MNPLQRISLRTWIAIIMVITALALALFVALAITAEASTAGPPLPPYVREQTSSNWETARAALRIKLRTQGAIGIRRAKRAGCITAQASYANTRYYATKWKLNAAKAWLIDARWQMIACKYPR